MTGLRVGMEIIAAGDVIEEGAGGAGGYLHALVPELRDDPRVEHLYIYAPAWYEAASEWSHPDVTVVRCDVPRRRPLRVAYEYLRLPARVRRSGVDVLFSPANYRPLSYRRCNVVALHAIQHFLLGDDIGRLRSAYLRFAVPRSVRTADMTVAVSEALRADAIELFDLDPARIVAVPMGPQPWVVELLAASEPVRFEPHRRTDGRPYVLCLSRLYALKNHRRLIRGFARAVAEHGLPHALVIAGGDGDVTRDELAEVARAAGVSDRVDLLGRVPQSAVGGLYAGAEACAYVSLYETFGHPVLEAFAMETPLVAAARGGIVEVAGGAARLVDPEREEDIASGLADVLRDPDLRERLVTAGRQRLTAFSWRECGRGTVDALVAAVEARRASAGAAGHLEVTSAPKRS